MIHKCIKNYKDTHLMQMDENKEEVASSFGASVGSFTLKGMFLCFILPPTPECE